MHGVDWVGGEVVGLHITSGWRNGTAVAPTGTADNGVRVMVWKEAVLEGQAAEVGIGAGLKAEAWSLRASLVPSLRGLT